MRAVNNIVLHCTATEQTATVEAIERYWKHNLGWRNPGYHYLIEASGKVHALLPESQVANGVAGHNHDSIHVSYIGGIDERGLAKDNRTLDQKAAMAALVVCLKNRYPAARILGHRDFPNVHKDCPSFNVKDWLKEVET